MDETLLNFLSEFGTAGLITLAAGWIIRHLIIIIQEERTLHSEERKAFLERDGEENRVNIEVIKSVTSAIVEVKTLLETMQRRKNE